MVGEMRAPLQMPCVWPHRGGAERTGWHEDVLPYDRLLQDATCLTGVVHGVDATGIHALCHAVEESSKLQVRLVIALYPATRTRQAELSRLCALQAGTDGRAQVRLSIMEAWGGIPANVLAFYGRDDRGVTIATGPTVDLNLAAATDQQVNCVFIAPMVLAEDWRLWFDWCWSEAVPLTERSCEIPALVPAKGTAEAAAIWEDYVRKCRQTAEGDTTAVTTRPVPGALAGEEGQTDTERPVSGELGLPIVGELERELARLYAKGSLATIEKRSRTPPLDAPMKAEWFGIDSFRQVGVARRRVQYRISAFDDKEQKALENFRKRAGELVRRFSFPLADGVRWMPHRVRPLFDRELSRVDEDATKLFKATITGNNIGQFLKERRQRIESDANRMYREFNPEGKLPARVADAIMDALAARLEHAGSGRFLPRVSYASVSPEMAGGARDEMFAQPLTLLEAIARFPREALVDEYFFRGLRIDRDEMVNGMDVCGDWIVARLRELGIEGRAQQELESIERIVSSEATDEAKCRDLLALVKGRPDRE